MDIISLYKNRIDALMDILFGAGVSNPQTIIEQLNYLLFLRALSIQDDEAELLGITDESAKIFSGELTKYRWQNLLALNAEDLFKTLETSFEVLQKKSQNSTVKLLFRNAHVKIFDKPTLRRVLHEIEGFAKELDKIAHEGNKDVFGDMYEYLLSKLSSAGTNGQFRTPRHIIDFMVRVVDPKKNETILDPACGTAGFLVAAYRYIAGEYTSDKMKKAGSPHAMDKLSSEEKKFMFNHMFTGFDSDEDMIKFGMMNLHLHGLTKSHLNRQNSLTDTAGMKDKYDVILANPPFRGKIDEESVSEDLRMGTKATEILFLRFMIDHLSLKGRLAVIVPEGVVFNASKAHAKIRQLLIEKGLWAVVSLPSGVFNPYAGVKTSLLFLDKEVAQASSELIFVKIENDGFDLGAQRRPIEKNNLPNALDILSKWKTGEKIKSSLATFVEKKQITKENHFNLSGDRYGTGADCLDAKYPVVKLEDYISTVTPPKKILKGNFSMFGSYPVIDQSQVEISGWTDDQNALVKVDKPLVIFGDHTCAVKYTERAFAQGADGIKIVKTNDNLLPRYLYYFLKVQPLESIGYQRHFAKLKNHKIVLPPLEVQKQIVSEIDSLQKIIDSAKQITETWRPLFEVDHTWDKVLLGDLAEYFIGLTYSPEDVNENGIVVLRSSNVQNGKLDFSDIVRVAKEVKGRLLVQDGDILMCSRNGSKRLVGKIAVIKKPVEKMTFGTFMTVIRSKHNQFLSYFFESDQFRSQIKLNGSETSSINQITKYMLDKIVVPFPPEEIRNQIVEKNEAERALVEATAKLIPLFEKKIKDRLAKLWN